MPQKNKCYLFESNKGYGFVSILDDKVNKVYLPMTTKTCAIKAATDFGTICKLDPQNSTAAFKVIENIKAYFRGEKVDFSSAEVCLEGIPAFHQKAYTALRKVRFGKTLSYKQLATAAGSPNAARAVGKAMASNPVPLIIPCHRVLSANQKIGGFTAQGGLDSKRWLLNNEGIFLS